MLNLSAQLVIFRVKDRSGNWRDYSRQVAASSWVAAKLPDRVAGGVLPATGTIQLLARAGDRLPVDDSEILYWKAETDIQLRAVDGNFYPIPSKMFILQVTEETDESDEIIGATIDLGCALRLKNRDSGMDSRALNIKVGGSKTLSNLATTALQLGGIASTALGTSGVTLNYPRGLGPNPVAAANKILDSARLIAWSQPTISTTSQPNGTGGAVYIDSLRIDTATPVKTVDVRNGDLLRFTPYKEFRTPDNQALLADQYLISSTVWAYRQTPSKVVDGNTEVVINFSAGTKTTTVTEEQLGSSMYGGLPGNYPQGEEIAQITIQKSTYNTSGSKALVQSEERTDQRVAISGQAAKGYFAGIYERLTAKQGDPDATFDADDEEDLANAIAALSQYDWDNLQQGAKAKTRTVSYDGEDRAIRDVTIEKMTRFELLSGLGNGVDWQIVFDSGINLADPITARTTTLNRFKNGGDWCEKTTATCLKCLGTEAQRADINYRLAQAYQGNAPEGEEPIPNEALYNQIIAEALTTVTLPPQQIRNLGNGETKPGSLDVMPERYTAEQVQVEAEKNFGVVNEDFTLKQALAMEFPGDFSATVIGGETAVRTRQRAYADTIGKVVRSRQRQRNAKGPLWPEILTNWRPWMAIDVIGKDGVKRRYAFDGIRIIFDQQNCFWEQQLMELGTVNNDGSLAA